jgi:hypothetical protein
VGMVGALPGHVFLSYARENADQADGLQRELEAWGISVWRDTADLWPGQDWRARIRQAITDNALVFLACFSRLSSSRERSYQNEELLLAVDELRRHQFGAIWLIPVRFEDCQVPELDLGAGRTLAGLQRADLFGEQADRELDRLARTIRGLINVPISAKEAVAVVRAERGPAGDLFGISQQGVASLYSLANLRDWEFADAASGTSRLWIAEFFDVATGRITPYAVMDGHVHDLPELYVNGTDPSPLSGSVISYSCAINHLRQMDEAKAQLLLDATPAEWTEVTRRYSRFRPIPLMQAYIDSPAAVAAAVGSAFGTSGAADRDRKLIILTRLECDKRYWQLPTWVIAFFDPTLTESVLTVGVNAITGAVRHPRMRTEILNADFMSIRDDRASGDIIVNVANQLRAMEDHVWDIPEDTTTRPPDLTAGDAIAMTAELLDRDGDAASWQIAFISNTGVTARLLNPDITGPQTNLTKRDGRAGQWVVEVCGLKPTPVAENGRHGYAYPIRRILCTATGTTTTDAPERIILPAALTPRHQHTAFARASDHARSLAIQEVNADFPVMSAVLDRAQGQWFFGFYDTENIIARITISEDGQRLISSQHTSPA